MNVFKICLCLFPPEAKKFITEPRVDNLRSYSNTFDVNSKCTYNDDTVLMMICKYSHSFNPLRYIYYIPHATEKIKWLFDHGVDPNIQDEDGRTALMLAAQYSSSRGLSRKQYILEQYKIYQIDPVKQRINKNIYFMIASYLQKEKNDIKPKSSEKVVKILLTVGGANPNIQDDYRSTALMLAAEQSSPERGTSSEKTVKILLTIGNANPNIQDKYGWTALMYAVQDSSPERGTSSERTVEMLLTAGANPNIQDNVGWFALMAAAGNSSPERGTSSEKTVEILLENGANPNIQHIWTEWTALMMAVRCSFTEYGESSEKTVEILLKGGADPNLQDEDGKTAIMVTGTSNTKQLIQKFIS